LTNMARCPYASDIHKMPSLVVLHLLRLFRTEHEEVRNLVRQVLADVLAIESRSGETVILFSALSGETPDKMVTALTQFVDDPMLRQQAIRHLGTIGTQAMSAVDKLQEVVARGNNPAAAESAKTEALWAQAALLRIRGGVPGKPEVAGFLAMYCYGCHV